jgi:hypothetical protein
MKKIGSSLVVLALATLMLAPVSAHVNKRLVNKSSLVADGNWPPVPFPPTAAQPNHTAPPVADGNWPPVPFPPAAVQPNHTTTLVADGNWPPVPFPPAGAPGETIFHPVCLAA